MKDKFGREMLCCELCATYKSRHWFKQNKQGQYICEDCLDELNEIEYLDEYEENIEDRKE